MTLAVLLLGVLVTSLVYAYFKLFYRKLRHGEPPLVPGHFLWGNGKQFMEHAVKFLIQSRNKFGDVFTIRFLHHHWTIMLDVHSYELFAREKNFDFEAIQDQVNHNVFSYTLINSRKMIAEAGQKVNGKYLFINLENFAKNITRAFKDTAYNTDSCSPNNVKQFKNLRNNDKSQETQQMYDKFETSGNIGYDIGSFPNWHEHMENPKTMENSPVADAWAEDCLRNVASKLIFSPLFYTIFGRGEPGREGNFHPQTVHKNFDMFHKYFNFLWLGLPRKIFPVATLTGSRLEEQPSSSEMVLREGCSDYIKLMTEYMLKNKQSERDIACHNLVFLHVNYNTFRVAYWLMYKLMEDTSAMVAIRKEVEEVVEAKRTGCNSEEYEAEFTTEDINTLPLVDSFLKEVIRVTSGVFMVRSCSSDTAFTTASGRTYNIRKGDKVAIYPPVFHHDPEIYPNPETFKYDRFVDAEFFKDGKKVNHPLVGFGSLCPGQKLSMLQLKWFIINVVNSFKVELVEGQKTTPNTSMYGQEILPPTHDVNCRYMAREGVCQLKYAHTYGSHGSLGLDGISSGNLL